MCQDNKTLTVTFTLVKVQDDIVRQRNSIFLKKRVLASIENVFVYSDRYGYFDL